MYAWSCPITTDHPGDYGTQLAVVSYITAINKSALLNGEVSQICVLACNYSVRICSASRMKIILPNAH